MWSRMITHQKSDIIKYYSQLLQIRIGCHDYSNSRGNNGQYQDNIMGYNPVQFRESRMFQKNTSSPFSGLNSKPGQISRSMSKVGQGNLFP